MNRDKVCKEDCEEPVWAKGYCRRHYDHAWRRGFPDSPLMIAKQRTTLPILGQAPVPGEKAIYFLRRISGSPFYVGSTNNPGRRLCQHEEARNCTDEIELVIVRCCPEGEEVYWECKLIVDLIDAGCSLENLTASQPSK